MSVLLVATPVVVGVVLFILLSKKLDKLGENMARRDDVQAVTDQLAKASNEITGKLNELDAKIAEGTISSEDLQPLRDAAQALDDIVPDAPAPEPVDPEAPVVE